MPHKPPSAGRNKTLYGLRTAKEVRIGYDATARAVALVVGLDGFGPEDVDVSESTAFNLPQFLSADGLPYFPSRYEFIEGLVWYHSRQPPAQRLQLRLPHGALSERAKVVQAKITPAMLDEFDLPARLRPRKPRQFEVMGESARDHAQRLVANGQLVVPPDSQVQWHWCHLVAFSMLPTHRAQVKRNLFVGTAACNGHMANIEYSLKRLIREMQRPLSIEVTVTVLADTHIGRRIRYQVSEPRSMMLHREYFDALTEVRSDVSDLDLTYEKLRASYEEALSNRRGRY
jgi:hypothetical protein